MNTTFFFYTETLLYVSAFKGPSSGSTDTFHKPSQQSTCSNVNIRLKERRIICCMAVVKHVPVFQCELICVSMYYSVIYENNKPTGRSQWPRGLRRRSLAARLLRLWVRIPPRAWIFVCCECCILSGRGLCDGLIIRSEDSYRLWCVVVCDQETSQARRLKPARGL